MQALCYIRLHMGWDLCTQSYSKPAVARTIRYYGLNNLDLSASGLTNDDIAHMAEYLSLPDVVDVRFDQNADVDVSSVTNIAILLAKAPKLRRFAAPVQLGECTFAFLADRLVFSSETRGTHVAVQRVCRPRMLLM